jgi:hypothetical protein
MGYLLRPKNFKSREMLLQNTSGAYIRSEILGYEQFERQIAKHRPLAVCRICLCLKRH